MFNFQIYTLAVALIITVTQNVCQGQPDLPPPHVNVTEGQNFTLDCTFDRWAVETNQKFRNVSDCSVTSRGCQNFEPHKFMGNISDTTQQPPPVPNNHRPTRLRVFNVEKDLTGVQCGSTRWNINVRDRESDYKIYAIVGVVVGSVALIILVILILFWCWRRERRSKNKQGATTATQDEKKVPPEVVVHSKDVFYTDIKMKEGLSFEAPPPYSSLQSNHRETMI